ncbi:STAS domain-containing protein [Streptomyces erythrochromogenes]|uniref:STAS domain-containing protein n=1 Tax=Streptomyces erythrochromogenes TaxID=285574 RepID=UPI0036C69982
MYENRSDIPESAALVVDAAPRPQTRTVTARVSDEIDFDNAATLRVVLLAALVSHRITLLVDLSQVTFCDCVDLHTLLAARTASQRAGRPMHTTAVGRPIAGLLQLTGTRDLLT